MTEKIIACFNGEECLYKRCPMYSPEMDTCKLELLKQNPASFNKPTVDKKPDTVKEPSGEVNYSDIIALEDGSQSFNVKGKLVYDAGGRTFTQKDGSEGTVGDIVVSDGQKRLKITFWGENTRLIEGLTQGDEVSVENIWKITGEYKVTKEANSGNYCEVKPL